MTARFPRSWISGDFNPRTPCGVRRRLSARAMSSISISIHAPLAGCDKDVRQRQQKRVNISIHAPLAGCDPHVSRSPHSAPFIFQSTHPLRGATYPQRRATGCGCHFNPRTPCGVRRAVHVSPRGAHPHFNPRTPCGVRRAQRSWRIPLPSISIHAPLAGCDGSCPFCGQTAV